MHGPRRAPDGFTLLEVLVVVAIAGALVALAAVNLFPSREETARRETGLLAMAIESARDDAWFGGRPVAISVDGARLVAWRLTGERTWEPDPAKTRKLGEGVAVTALAVDGQPIAPTDRLVFLADGFGVPFRMTVQAAGLERAIEGDAAGAIRLVEAPK